MGAYIRNIQKSIIQWMGGKYALIKPISREILNCQIIAQDAGKPIEKYIEPFGGGARLLLNHQPAVKQRYYNEINQNLCSLFRVVQQEGDALDALVRMLYSKKYSRDSFEEAQAALLQEDLDEIERAMHTYVLVKQSFFGMGESFRIYSESNPTTFEENHKQNNSIRQNYYKNIDNLYAFSNRLRDVEIICGDFRDIILRFQGCEDALYVCDPPYYDRDDYSTGWTASDRRDLVDMLLDCKCKVILSGYDTAMYNELLADEETANAKGWRRIYLGEFHVAARKGENEGEYLWVNY